MDQDNIIYMDYYHIFLVNMKLGLLPNDRKDGGVGMEEWERKQYQEDGENCIKVTVITLLFVRHCYTEQMNEEDMCGGVTHNGAMRNSHKNVFNKPNQ
jgi:hypothetical protein